MYEIREHLASNLSIIPNAIALPTGDGVAIVLVHNEPDVWNTTIVVRLVLRLIEWQIKIKANSEIGREIRIRMGVHYGGLEFFTDINGKTNVCGNTINMAQRVMDAANDSQALFSIEAEKRYFGSDFSRQFNYEEALINIELKGPLSVTVKHGVRLDVFVFAINNIGSNTASYDNNIPGSSKYLVVSTTKLPKAIEGDFEEKLKQGEEVAFIQLTGENLLTILETQTAYFSASLKRLFVLMPSSTNPVFHGKEKDELVQGHIEYIDRWKKVIVQLRDYYKGLSARLYLFEMPPYFGGSFVDWTRPGGSIHVSPYIWGTQAKNCPGYDMVWTGSDRPEIFTKYVQGLDYLMGETRETFS